MKRSIKNIIITGGNGQLGQSIRELSVGSPHNFSFVDIDDFDITDENKTLDFFADHACDVLINCAAYTAVDKAETQPSLADKVNHLSLENLSHAGKRYGFKLLHISTDYVFDGESSTPYKETDMTNPQTIYGVTKLKGEMALLSILPESIIIRTAWLYSNYGKNFYLNMLNKAINNTAVRVVADQKGTPTNAEDLGAAIIAIIHSNNWTPGVYHFSNEGETTWYDFTKSIYTLAGVSSELVIPIRTEEYKALAKRPAYSVLNKQKIKDTFNITIPQWEDSLKSLYHKDKSKVNKK